MFTLTPSAAEQIIRAAATQSNGDSKSSLPSLRVAAKIEEGEIAYGMGFDDERDHDAVFESCGVTLLIAPPSQELLNGAVLDFVELKPGEFQFIFIHPENLPARGGCASHSTGCGSCGGGTTGGCN